MVAFWGSFLVSVCGCAVLPFHTCRHGDCQLIFQETPWHRQKVLGMGGLRSGRCKRESSCSSSLDVQVGCLFNGQQHLYIPHLDGQSCCSCTDLCEQPKDMLGMRVPIVISTHISRSCGGNFEGATFGRAKHDTNGSKSNASKLNYCSPLEIYTRLFVRTSTPEPGARAATTANAGVLKRQT